MKKLFRTILAFFNFRVVVNDRYLSLLKKHYDLCLKTSSYGPYSLLHKIKPNYLESFVSNIHLSTSDTAIDLFVLSEVGFKKNGYFVEFGACNGIGGSNSYLLETKFGWKGILAEPAKTWHKELVENRSAFIEKDCVYSQSNETLIFNEVRSNLGYSTIDRFSDSDGHKEIRKKGLKYKVNTISLVDLLDKYHAPDTIDYLSIDTEGSEFKILSSFDFKKYKFKVITCEHNYTENREKVAKLLTENGYVRKFIDISQHDDWYVLAEKS